MNYLLTGATGYLGSRLLEALIYDGHQVIVLKRSSSDTGRINRWLDRITCCDVDANGINSAFDRHAPFDAVIHAATCYGRRGESCPELVETNLLFPLRVLERAGKGGAGLFLNTDTSLSRELNAYALSKKQFAEWGQRLAIEGKLRWVNMVLEHFYGSGDDESKLVTWLVRSCLAHVPEIPLTKGEQRRDFIHIDDVVHAYRIVLSAGLLQASAEYAVGSGHTVAIRDVAGKIRDLCNSTSKLNFGAIPYRPNEIMNSRADIGMIKSLGWSPVVSLEDGLRELVASERKKSSL